MVRTFTPIERAFIIKNYKGTPNKDLTNMFNQHFGTNFKESKFINYKKHNNLNSGLTGWYKKGNKPFCTGLKAEDYMSPERLKQFREKGFQKGNIPYNHVKIGSEKSDEHGYLLEKIKEPNVWRKKHAHIWEVANNKKIPKGYIVIFLDGNNRNFDIDNLKLISKAENVRLNKIGLRFECAELTETAVNLVRLENKIREVQ